MKTTKVALIIPLFDAIPEYFDLFLNQLSYQRNIDILILTNQSLEKYQLLPHLETKEIEKPIDLKKLIKEDFDWFISTRTYWSIGNVKYLYGNLYKFVHQLTKNNPNQFELKGNQESMLFYKSIPTDNTEKVSLSKAELTLNGDNIISFNQGRIFNYYNRKSFAFMDIDNVLKNQHITNPNWKEAPVKFFLSESGFYTEKEFRTNNLANIQQKIKTKGLRYFFSIRHFIKKSINDVEVVSQKEQKAS